MDKDWFDQQFARRGKSMRGLANHLDVDVSAVSRMFSGQRRMKPDEIGKIARYLELPAEEIVRRAGMPDLMKHVRTYEVEAEIGPDFKAVPLKKPRALPPAVIAEAEAQIGSNAGQIGIAQIRAADGSLAMWDDAVLVYEKTDFIEPEAVGVLSMVKLRDGVQMLGRLKSTRKTGESVIVLPDGKEKVVDLVSAGRARVVP